MSHENEFVIISDGGFAVVNANVILIIMIS